MVGLRQQPIATALKMRRDTVNMPSVDSKARVDSRTVFQPNARTKRSFSGHIVGCYRRVGPNSWDDYHLVSEDGGSTNIYPAIKVQVEAEGARFRMRKNGKVVVVEWTPTPEDKAALSEHENENPRAAFLKHCMGSFKNKGGMGTAAFIAKSLNR